MQCTAAASGASDEQEDSKPMRVVVWALAALAPLAAAHAQSTEVYKVELTLRDAGDASAKAGRNYTILIDTRGAGTFKIGDRVPVASGSFQPGTGGTGINPLVNTQFTYIDVGVNIDCHLEPVSEGRVQLRTDLDISNATPSRTQGISNPVIGQLKLSVNSLLTPGKRTVIAAVDDPVTNHRFDVEALVTKAE